MSNSRIFILIIYFLNYNKIFPTKFNLKFYVKKIIMPIVWEFW